MWTSATPPPARPCAEGAGTASLRARNNFHAAPPTPPPPHTHTHTNTPTPLTVVRPHKITSERAPQRPERGGPRADQLRVRHEVHELARVRRVHVRQVARLAAAAARGESAARAREGIGGSGAREGIGGSGRRRGGGGMGATRGSNAARGRDGGGRGGGGGGTHLRVEHDEELVGHERGQFRQVVHCGAEEAAAPSARSRGATPTAENMCAWKLSTTASQHQISNTKIPNILVIWHRSTKYQIPNTKYQYTCYLASQHHGPLTRPN